MMGAEPSFWNMFLTRNEVMKNMFVRLITHLHHRCLDLCNMWIFTATITTEKIDKKGHANNKKGRRHTIAFSTFSIIS
jgi:hypothetical protein